MRLLICDPISGIQCKSASEIEAFFAKNPTVQLFFTEHYLATGENTKIIKQLINNVHYLPVVPGARAYADCFLRPITVWSNTGTEFYQASTVGRFEKSTTPYQTQTGNTLIELNIRLDDIQDLTVIKRSGWYDAISNVGGFEGFIFFGVAFLL